MAADVEDARVNLENLLIESSSRTPARPGKTPKTPKRLVSQLWLISADMTCDISYIEINVIIDLKRTSVNKSWCSLKYRMFHKYEHDCNAWKYRRNLK